MDITSTFKSLLPRSEPEIASARPQNAPKDPSLSSRSFLQTAQALYSTLLTLHRTLLDLRKTYLSLTASPTAVSQIDDEANAMLRAVAAKLREFEEAEAIRITLAKEKRRREARWKVWKLPEDGGDGAESGEEKIVREFREAVVWMLKERLERVSEVVRGMREKRVSRAVGRLESSPFAGASISQFSEARESTGATNPSAVTARNQTRPSSWDVEGIGLEEGEASGEMMQLFEEENREMLKGFEGMMEGVRNAERSLVEISELQLQLAASLSQQSEHIDQLVQDSLDTTENLEQGNKQLKEAAKKPSLARYFFWGAVGFSTTMVIWDFLI
ncbi:hypothetical protein BJ508DRAFT_413232 [Ascobolus immersus RN42]|uniref:t-SNARE coiled-coil homology domain-containing protein n=1 Tax=Ascobolus immersus RN42 TaxID=1160509 RepID=A0A3N4IDC5_ASCIM|nr:hypothetical protein BJ508DRAFT_413232 [Ascobolus immersus RN42]